MTTFIGSGDSTALGRPLPPWINSRGERIADERHSRHPAGYLADPGLIDAVNTALILGKPLLLTGRPGSGKSELAERVAWEFALSPVLRFEAQSLSEAQELFYRFDLVGQMADAQLAVALGQKPQAPEAFLTFGPLGKAILHANPTPYQDLADWDRLADAARQTLPADAPPVAPLVARRSVVLIDEIDKAARDVPNDLLNGIERLEFRIRELRNRPVAAPDEPTLRPIVMITSNSERDLPEPFLRRCVFHHIAEPNQDKLREILRARVAGLDDRDPGDAGNAQSGIGRDAGRPLAPFYEALLSFFVAFRDDPGAQTAYTPGTSELLDWARVLRQLGADTQRDLADNAVWLARSLGAVVKHGDDLAVLQQAFIRLRGLDLRPPAAQAGARTA